MTVRVNQPDEFFPWLAAWIGKAGPFACAAVTYDASGCLAIAMHKGGHHLTVTWSVPRPREGEVSFRDGSLRVDAGPDLRSEVATAALRQVRTRIDSIRTRAPLPLLERRNREIRSVRLGEGLIASVCSGMLDAGVTRCGLFHFDDVTFAEGVVRLSFRWLAGTHTLTLCAEGTAVPGVPIGRYGPLVLAGPEKQSRDADRLARYVGYALSLSLHGDMQLQIPDEVSDSHDVGSALGPIQNPFLYEHASCGGQLVAAMFASRGNCVSVFHSDRECAGFAAYLTGVTETAYLPLSGVRPTLSYLRNMRIVDTNELDAIMTGCETELTDLVKETVEQRPDLLMVMGTCVSRVIGDSVENAVVDAGAEEHEVPTVWLETTATEQDQHHRILWRRLVELFQKPRVGAGRAVNLFGYGHWRTQGLGELERLLQSVGVRRNAAVIPTFDIEEVKQIGEADLNLLVPSDTARSAMLWARECLRAPVLEFAAPFGVEQTRAWVDSVARFYGMDPLGEDWMERYFGPSRSHWETLVDRARAHRVAIVLTFDHFDRSTAMVRGGTPWIALLEEMGFGLDIHMIPPQETAHDDTAVRERAVGQVNGVLREPARHSVKCFGSMQDLRIALAQSTAELMYTEVVADRRAFSSGKIPISYVDFEMGFEGACRSLERLLGFAQTPFYRRYGRRLSCDDW